MTYELKFKDGGVWMDTKSFAEFVEELSTLGFDVDSSFVDDGIQFTLKKSDE